MITKAQEEELYAKIRGSVEDGYKKEYSKTACENIAKREYKRGQQYARLKELLDSLSKFMHPMLNAGKGRGMIQVSNAICEEIRTGLRRIDNEMKGTVNVANGELQLRKLTLQDCLIAAYSNGYKLELNIGLGSEGYVARLFVDGEIAPLVNGLQPLYNLSIPTLEGHSDELKLFLHSLLV